MYIGEIKQNKMKYNIFIQISDEIKNTNSNKKKLSYK